MSNTHNLEIDVDLKENLIITATCKQLDDLNLTFNVWNNGEMVDLSEYKCRLKAFKQDQIPLIQNTSININNNVVNIIADEQFTTTSGTVKVELQFINKNTGKKKSTFNIIFKVMQSVLEVERSISKATCTLLKEIDYKLDQIEDIKLDIIEAVKVKNDLNTSKVDANSMNNTLKATTTNADNKKKEVETAINNASNKIKEVQDSTNAANTAKQAVDNSVISANSTKQALDTSRVNADITKKEVDASVKVADEKIEIIKNLDPENVVEDVKKLKEQVLENTYTKLETDSTLTKLESCKDSFVHNMLLRGRTLQNVIQPIKNITFKKIDSARALNIDLIKLNADYSFILDLGNVIGGTNTIHLQATYSDGTIEYPTFSGVVNNIANNITVKKVSFKKELSSLKLAINVANADDVSVTVNSLMVIEGEPKEIPPYFEGIKSTGELEGNKISILTKGKNWIDIDKFIVDDDSRNCIREINSLIMTSKVPTKWQSVGITLNLKLNTEYSIIGNSEVINKSAYPCIRIGVEYPNGSFTSLAISTTKLETTFKTPQNLNGGRIKLLLYTCFDGKLCDENSIIKYSNLQITEGKDFTYEEYKEDKTEILTNEPLRGLPSGISDVINYENNEITRNVGKIVLNGNESWAKQGQEFENTALFSILFPVANTAWSPFNNLICDKFLNDNTWSYDKEGVSIDNAKSLNFRILKSKLLQYGFINGNVGTYVPSLKKWFQANPVAVYYQLAEPKIEKLNIKDELQTFQDGYIQLDNAITPYAQLEYSTNLPSALGGLTQVADKLVDDVTNVEITISDMDAEVDEARKGKATLNERLEDDRTNILKKFNDYGKKDGTLQRNLNAEMLGGFKANDFSKNINFNEDAKDIKTIMDAGIHRSRNWLNYPSQCHDGQGTVISIPYNEGWHTNIFITPHTGEMFEISCNNFIWGEEWKQLSTTEKFEVSAQNQWYGAWTTISDRVIFCEKNGLTTHVGAILSAGISTNDTVVAQFPNVARDKWLYVLCEDKSIAKFYLGLDGKLYAKFDIKQGLIYNFDFSYRSN